MQRGESFRSEFAAKLRSSLHFRIMQKLQKKKKRKKKEKKKEKKKRLCKSEPAPQVALCARTWGTHPWAGKKGINTKRKLWMPSLRGAR